MRFIAEIKNKTIIFSNIPYVRHHLEKFEGKKVIVEVEKRNNKRSLNQNRYYWLCLKIIAEYTGHDADDLHRIFKGLYLPKKEVILRGKKFYISSSTTDLTKGMFTEYMLYISAEASQMGITLPSPEDYQKGIDIAPLLTE